MFKRNTIPASFLSAFALTAIFLAIAVVYVKAGAPLKGVDVKLGRNPGGNNAARAMTNSAGHFTFPVQPAGSYTLTIERPQDAADSAMVVSVKGAAGGPITKTFNGMIQSTAKTGAVPARIDLKSDGQTALTGDCQTTVVKTKSNVKNE